MDRRKPILLPIEDLKNMIAIELRKKWELKLESISIFVDRGSKQFWFEVVTIRSATCPHACTNTYTQLEQYIPCANHHYMTRSVKTIVSILLHFKI